VEAERSSLGKSHPVSKDYVDCTDGILDQRIKDKPHAYYMLAEV
jgi:hypothetical protein